MARVSALLNGRVQQLRGGSSQTKSSSYFALSPTAYTRFRPPFHLLSSYSFNDYSVLGARCLALPPTLLPTLLTILLGRILLGYPPFMTVKTILCRC